jgi:3-(methylthio)propanoyl-CoA dehydrogenase
MGRKLMRDKGEAANSLIVEMRGIESRLAAQPGDDLATIRAQLAPAVDALEAATLWIVANWEADPARALAGAVPYLRLLGTVAGGWIMATAALAAHRRLAARDGDPTFNEAKLVTARFYAEQYLPIAAALLPAIRGGGTVMSFAVESF